MTYFCFKETFCIQEEYVNRQCFILNIINETRDLLIYIFCRLYTSVVDIQRELFLYKYVYTKPPLPKMTKDLFKQQKHQVITFYYDPFFISNFCITNQNLSKVWKFQSS